MRAFAALAVVLLLGQPMQRLHPLQIRQGLLVRLEPESAGAAMDSKRRFTTIIPLDKPPP